MRKSHIQISTAMLRRDGMRTRCILSKSSNAIVAILIFMYGMASPVVYAQAQNGGYTQDLSKSVKSRAEQEAEQSVALSADSIIEMLRQEPGLLLESKKMLVRKAYEQGRILDPEDLTHDALFQLLREAHTICVLVTREIEDRGY